MNLDQMANKSIVISSFKVSAQTLSVQYLFGAYSSTQRKKSIELGILLKMTWSRRHTSQ